MTTVERFDVLSGLPQRGGFNRPPDTDVMLFHKHHVWGGGIRAQLQLLGLLQPLQKRSFLG